MGELKVKLSDAAEQRFRKAAMERFGYQKGSLSMAAEKAMNAWLEEREGMEAMRQMALAKGMDPIKAIKGVLKHVRKSSVELQHKAAESRYQRWKKHVSA